MTVSLPHEEETLEIAASRMLRSLGERLGWDVGELWTAGPNGALRCTAEWQCPSRGALDLSAKNLHLSPGTGAPGMAWKTARPVWITDVTRESTMFIRSDLALRYGLHTACAFPVFHGGALKAVVLFMSRKRREPDAVAIKACEAAAAKLSQLAL